MKLDRFTDEARAELVLICAAANVADAEGTVRWIESQCVAALSNEPLDSERKTREQTREKAQELAKANPDDPLLRLIASAPLPRGPEPDRYLHWFVLMLRHHLVRAGFRHATSERSCLVQAIEVILAQVLEHPPDVRALLRDLKGSPLLPLPPRGPRIEVP